MRVCFESSKRSIISCNLDKRACSSSEPISFWIFSSSIFKALNSGSISMAIQNNHTALGLKGGQIFLESGKIIRKQLPIDSNIWTLRIVGGYNGN